MPQKTAPQARHITLPRSGLTVPYELVRGGVKNLNLRVRRDGTVHASVPRRTTVAEVEAFLADHEDWLLSAREKMAARTAAHPTAAGVVGDTLPYLGGTLALEYQIGTPAAVEAQLDEGRLLIRLPDPANADLRLAAVETFERAETTRLVTALIARHHPRFAALGVPYPAHIRVKRLRSRHGSCSPRTGSLNFSLRLCEYPPAFVEYVVVHELCHFLVPDHSPSFHRALETVLPDARAREKLGKF